MNFVQNETTKLFIQEVNRLIQTGTVDGYKALAEKIGWDKTAISNVMNNRRNVPNKIFAAFTEVFNLENPARMDYKEKYYTLLEQRIKEADRIEPLIRELVLSSKQMSKRIEQLEKNSGVLHHSLIVSAAMQTAYQEWVIDHVSGEGNNRKVMNQIRKKAVALLTSFESKGIGVDMGIVNE